MSEVYWIAGGDAADIPALLEGTRVKPERVDQTIWLGKAPPEFNPLGAFFGWGLAPLLDHYMLQAAGRTILTGGADLIVIGQQVGQGFAVALLASPVAVGKFNILPRARLGAFLTLSPTCVGLAEGILEAGSDPTQITALALDGQDEEGILPGVKRIPLPRGCCSRAVSGLNRLAQRKKGTGMLLGRLADNPALAVVVERI